MPEPAPLYPLLLEPIYKEKVWGGRALEAQLGRDLPGGGDTLVGESWELADLGTTSASGGGGGAERSVIANGPLAGQTLHDVIQSHGRSLLGDLPLNEAGEFPLLLKFLDARQNLSVQVHPNAEYARQHDDAYLKSEAWYVLHTEPGAVIYKGVKAGTTPEQFRRAIEDNAVEPLLIEVPVQAGDCHYLPSGTCHALGAGVLVAEVQTPSDTTFRVYDWGRTGRELHVDQAMQCITFGPADTAKFEKHDVVTGKHTTLTRLVACEYFRVDKLAADAGFDDDLTHRQPKLWMVLEGGGVIHDYAGAPDVPFARGQTLLLPAEHHGGTLHLEQDTTWLEVTFPQASPHRIA